MTGQLNQDELKELTDFSLSLAMRAGDIQKRELGHVHDVEYKGASEVVTRVDRLCEDVIVEEITDRFSDHNIVTEESEYPQTNHPFRWYIDPLDGTTNYVHGYCHFSVSIGLEVSGEMVLGVVCDPMMNEMFWGIKDAGAHLNGQMISVSQTGHLNRSLLATGFPYHVRHRQRDNMENFSRLSLASQAIRVDGSAALNLCYVAVGRFDGFWEISLRSWDLAAGTLIVREAGGRVSHLGNGSFRIDSGEVLATNGLIHDEMASILKDGGITGGSAH
jgi:myo-inositol-1(or 4)-monophosphatase